ncbi:MAG: TRAP transporter small permease subunit [Magnetovibrionaceae bacterium]
MSQQDDDVPHVHTAEVYDNLLEHEETTHVWLSDKIDHLIQTIGHVVCWANGILVFVIIAQVFNRYVLHGGSIAMEELQWHLYGAAVMFGISYAITQDSHIRVDILYHKYKPRTKRIVEIVGIVFFLLPFAWVIFDHSIPFVVDSFRTMEGSDSASGLPYRWIIKAVIPISFGLVILAAVSRLIRDVTLLIRGEV